MASHLQNGLPVVVVENHEVPFVWVRLVLEAGTWSDPDDRPGLAAFTMDLLLKGAGRYDDAGLTNAARALYNGQDPGSAPWQALAWAVGIIAVFSVLAIRRFSASRR